MNTFNQTPIHVIKARLWEWEGKGAWHFITIEKEQGQEIKNDWHWPRKGFGSMPVEVRIGSTKWRTSIFPEKGGSYLLPIKKSVREEKNIRAGDTLELEICVLT